MNIKAKRISSQIQKEISNIVLNEFNNDILKKLNITSCEVTNDLSFAKLFYTYLGNFTSEEIQKELEKNTPYLRKKLANAIEIRHTPELIFVFDESIAYGNNIEKLIAKIHLEK